MSKRIIQSPGVEIQERDLSLRTPSPAGTTVYTTGFSDQGPTDEVISVSSITEFERIYGTPKTPAERYFYHTVKSTLNSPSRLLVNRLPYGENSGIGFGTSVGILAYPARVVSDSSTSNTLSATTITLNYSEVLGSIPLSGAAFTFFDSTATLRTVVFDIDDEGPVRQPSEGVIVVDIDSSIATFSTILTSISSAIDSIVPSLGITFTKTNNSLTLKLSADDIVTSTSAPAISASVVKGLDDNDDVFVGEVLIKAEFTTGITTNFNQASGTYVLGKPTQFNITRDQYLKLVSGQLFSEWSETAADNEGNFASVNALGGAAVIVINKAQTIIDGKFTGYYVGLADNTLTNPASGYSLVQSVQTVTQSASPTGLRSYVTIPQTRFDFALSATAADGNSPAQDSLSQILQEKITGYDTSSPDFDDTLNLGIFKLRQSVFATDANTLGVVLEEGYNGSIGYYRQTTSELGGAPVNFFLENVENDSRNIEILVNPYISDQFRGVNINNDGTPRKKIRLSSKQLRDGLTSNSISTERAGITNEELTQISTLIGDADSIFPIGVFGETTVGSKEIGNVPAKLTRALNRITNTELFDIDIIAEGGLGTIWTYCNTNSSKNFDDTKTTNAIEALRTSSTLTQTDARDAYNTIFSKFVTFAGPTKDGGRGDILYIADPLRQILVTGKDNKINDDPARNFSTDIYWPLRHLYSNANTSYATAYANFLKVFDDASGLFAYVPASGFVAARMVSTDVAVGPWGAPAGLNRGIITDAIDVALSPNQRQRDDLYTISLNPIATFPDQGIVVFGQKTMLKKPSAFDRVNVRRSFLFLEKATKSVMKFFIFENNTLFTRTQVTNTLTPFFERVRAADGLVDFIIVCDERNNTPEVIDNNELVVDIYLKPVRTAEFIRVNFYATRTDTNFEELLGS